jgi:hypothetical protein
LGQLSRESCEVVSDSTPGDVPVSLGSGNWLAGSVGWSTPGGTGRLGWVLSGAVRSATVPGGVSAALASRKSCTSASSI